MDVEYIVLRSHFSVRSLYSDPKELIVVVPTEAISTASSVSERIDGILDTIPQPADEIHMDLGQVVCLDPYQEIDSAEPELDLLMAVTAIDRGWCALSKSDHDRLAKLDGIYTFQATLRAVKLLIPDERPQLYVELEHASQYWLELP